jgi:DNA (cytosine-5)-methyltransferase 1
VRKLRAIDVFAGGGGLTVGLKAAKFSVVAGVELSAAARNTYKANHRRVKLFEDVKGVTGPELLQAAGGRLDLLAACPPCQGFCTLTRRTSLDPRNDLVLEVARLVEETLPRCLMMENVPGLAKGKGAALFNQLLARLKSAGYTCKWDILQVADYGIPQRRRRLVLLAGKGFTVDLPTRTHDFAGRDGLQPWRTLADALLEVAQEPVTLLEALAAGGPQNFNWHVVRNISDKNKVRLSYAEPGKLRGELPVEVRPPCHQGSDKGFHNSYGRLRWDQPSVTITAGCTTPSKGRFGHPDRQSTLSLREAALLQTFPMNYRIETDHMERACEIVGNALPCAFAKVVARQCRVALLANVNN